jgi:hypothetical protein
MRNCCALSLYYYMNASQFHRSITALIIMLYKSLIPSLLFCCFVMASCRPEPQIRGLWLGGALEIDKSVYQALPVLWDFQKDSVTVFAFESNTTIPLPWGFAPGQLKIDTTWLTQLSLTDKTLSLDFPYRMHFHKIPLPTQEMNSAAIHKKLAGHYWSSDVERIHLDEDQTLRVLAEGQSNAWQYCWQISSYGNYQFLIRKGNPFGCAGFVQYPEYILRVEDDFFETLRWLDGAFQVVRYDKMPPSAAPAMQAAPFQTCNPYLYINNPANRYYYKGTFYKGGIYAIRKEVDRIYQPVPIDGEDGLIRIRFIVNCQGQAGQYEVLELDNDYRPKTFDSSISGQLLAITRQLQDWKAGKLENGIPIDTYRILTFRIDDGQVIDIFP